MQDIINGFFYGVVLKHLEDNYGYDFMAEIFELTENVGERESSITVGYRGHHGEYGSLTLEGITTADLLKEFV